MEGQVAKTQPKKHIFRAGHGNDRRSNFLQSKKSLEMNGGFFFPPFGPIIITLFKQKKMSAWVDVLLDSENIFSAGIKRPKFNLSKTF